MWVDVGSEAPVCEQGQQHDIPDSADPADVVEILLTQWGGVGVGESYLHELFSQAATKAHQLIKHIRNCHMGLSDSHWILNARRSSGVSA